MDLWIGQGLWAPDPRPACDPPGQGGLEEEGGRDRRATERGTGPPARQTETLQPPGIRPRPADGTEIRARQARRGNPRNQTPISPATFAASAQDVGRRMGGVASTQEKRATSLRIWREAMSELGIPEAQWMLFSEENFQRFAGWAALRLNRQDLDFITAMLNKLGSPREAWVKQATILSIKAAYIERRAFDVACRPDLQEERERICIADSRLRAFIGLGERISGQAGGWAQADHDRLGVISWILIMTLFVVRASTMGALKDASDVWFEENTEWPTREGTTRQTRSLCFKIRFLKHWRGGRQLSTGRYLPIDRAGRDSIPIPAEPGHWRTRASLVIEAAVNSRAIEWYSRRGRSPPEGAAGAMDKKLEEFNWVVGDSTRPGLRNTSHSGRMTGVSIGCQLGADREVLRSWMIVCSTETVIRYVRRNYESGPVGRDLMAFLRDKA